MTRNIVLLSVDSLRADFCPWLAETDFQTPALNHASESGLTFERAVSPGHATPCSMTEIFTGHRLLNTEDSGPTAGLCRYHETITETLSRKDYATIGFTPNPYTSREFGFDTGFNHFDDFFGRGATVVDRLRTYVRENWQNRTGRAIRLGLNLVGQGDITVGWRDYYDEVLEQVDAASEPFFLWIFLLEPHWPYFPSKQHRDDVDIRDLFTNYKRSRASNMELSETDGDRLRRLYRNTIKDVDDFVERIQTDLSEYDPAYIFHSDHGESFGEHGNWGHMGDLHEENIHVPLEVWNVGVSETVTNPFSLRQIPSIVELIANGTPEEIPSLSSPFASAHNFENDISIAGKEWLHYPVGERTVPDSLSELADAIHETERERFEEAKRIRSATENVELGRI